MSRDMSLATPAVQKINLSEQSSLLTAKNKKEHKRRSKRRKPAKDMHLASLAGEARSVAPRIEEGRVQVFSPVMGTRSYSLKPEYEITVEQIPSPTQYSAYNDGSVYNHGYDRPSYTGSSYSYDDPYYSDSGSYTESGYSGGGYSSGGSYPNGHLDSYPSAPTPPGRTPADGSLPGLEGDSYGTYYPRPNNPSPSPAPSYPNNAGGQNPTRSDNSASNPSKPIAPMPQPPVAEGEANHKDLPENKKPVNEEKTHKTLHDVEIYDNNFAVTARGNGAVVTIEGGTIGSNFIVLNALEGGVINAKDVTVTAVGTGLLLNNGEISLKDSTVNVTGSHDSHGIFFRNGYTSDLQNRSARSVEYKNIYLHPQGVINKATLENTKLSVKDGVGMNATLASGAVVLKDSAISADILSLSGQSNKDLENQQNSEKAPNLLLTANHSYLEGRAQTLGASKTVFDLNNGTKWVLKPSKNQTPRDGLSDLFGVDAKSYSSLSALSVQNSSIIFEEPIEGRYQVLHIGFKPENENGVSNILPAYSAEGNADLYLNAEWSHNAPVTEQKTDRVLIKGNVLGNTDVYVNLREKDKKLANSETVWEKSMASTPASTHGISLIQVSGKAEKDSFRLANGYITMKGLPYKYVLTAYGPGESDTSQNMLGGKNNDFWDYRLQNEYVDKNKNVRAVLPQVANYLVMPNSLFSAGYTDANNQNIIVENMRAEAFGTEKSEKKQGIFLFAYDDRTTLSSDRSPLQYGYGADVNYHALQAGVTLAALESDEITTDVGLLGTYGQLSFTPKDMKNAEKTTFDKWSVTAYGGIQHDSGLYVNTFVSYGALKGDITAPLIKGTTKLDNAQMLSASSTIGQKLATGMEELVFEPQAQLVYQKLMFNTIQDAEGFEVDMNNPYQWLVRVGGRLTKTIISMNEGNAFSFYGKLNVLKAFGDNRTIKIGDTFHLSSMGSSIEGGVGVNARFSQNIAFHGGVSYRHKLQKAGSSGTNFFGGLSYNF
ncbi:autotransporter outer membrane beta-barrel domain-containing protein [Bartonella sp. B30(2025)]